MEHQTDSCGMHTSDREPSQNAASVGVVNVCLRPVHSTVTASGFFAVYIRVGAKPGLWTGLDWTVDWTEIWTGFWTDAAFSNDHFQLNLLANSRRQRQT